jgi:hypothetical protein
MAKENAADVLNKESAESALFPAKGLPGGGQLEIRMEVSANHPDPDIRSVARRLKPYNLESWYSNGRLRRKKTRNSPRPLRETTVN